MFKKASLKEGRITYPFFIHKIKNDSRHTEARRCAERNLLQRPSWGLFTNRTGYRLMKVLLLLAVFLRTSSKERILQPSNTVKSPGATRDLLQRWQGFVQIQQTEQAGLKSSLYTAAVTVYTTGHITDRKDEQRSAHIHRTIANFHSLLCQFSQICLDHNSKGTFQQGVSTRRVMKQCWKRIRTPLIIS